MTSLAKAEARYRALGLAILFLAVLWAGVALGARSPVPAVHLGDDFQKIQLGPRVEFLRDPSAKLSLAEVISPPLVHAFQPHRQESFSRGFEKAAYWLRFRLEGKKGILAKLNLILAITRPVTDEIDLYVPVGEGRTEKFLHLRSGARYYGHSDDLGYRLPAVPIPENYRMGSYIYLRIYSQLVHYAVILFNQKSLIRQVRFDYLFFGITAGIMLAMFLYNLSIALVLRDRVYAYYCIYISLINLYLCLLSGWPLGLGLSPGLLLDSILKFHFATLLFAFLFSREFLGTKTKHPRLDITLKSVAALMAIMFCLSFFVSFNLANKIAYTGAIPAALILILCAAIRCRQGYKPARYYLGAWFSLIFSTIIYALGSMGFYGYSHWLGNAPYIGGALESILLSFALADRIRAIKLDREILKKREEVLTELSITDDLTGLYNKRWFTQVLARDMQRSRRQGDRLSLLMLDVDHFKGFNDTYGHATGDQVLAELARAICRNIRSCDIPCRYGGEEFAIILPGVDLEKAQEVAERVRQDFGRQRLDVESLDGYGEKAQVGATVSVGVAQARPSDDPASLFERADHSLYQAKTRGRDRVVAL